MEQRKIKKIKKVEPLIQLYIPKIIDLNININQQFIKDIIEKLDKFNKCKIKFIEQYLLFLELHNNLLNNGIVKLEIRSVTYRQNFELNYGQYIREKPFELHHIFGNRNSNKFEEIIAFNPMIHKYYHEILDNINILYQNLIKKMKIIENIEEEINFIKLKYNDKKNINLLGLEIKELMEYIDNNSKNYQNITIIPDELVEKQLEEQTNILWKQFYTLTDDAIINDEINKLNYTIRSINKEIENYIKKDILENIIRNINNKYLCDDSSKSKKKDSIIVIYEKIIKAINENKITKKEIGNIILIESIGCTKQLEQTTNKNRINGINNRIKKLEEIRINLNELLDYRNYLIERLDSFNKLRVNEYYKLVSNIRIEKMNKVSIINNYIDTIIKCRKENQKFLINSIKSSEFYNILKEINDCFDNNIKKDKIKNISFI